MAHGNCLLFIHWVDQHSLSTDFNSLPSKNRRGRRKTCKEINAVKCSHALKSIQKAQEGFPRGETPYVYTVRCRGTGYKERFYGRKAIRTECLFNIKKGDLFHRLREIGHSKWRECKRITYLFRDLLISLAPHECTQSEVQSQKRWEKQAPDHRSLVFPLHQGWLNHLANGNYLPL